MNTFKAVVTAALIAAFAALIAFLLSEVGASQASWERYVYLLSGVEAVVFAAVGWLFGKEVHREQAEKAEANAEEATTKHLAAATEAATEKATGLSLARAVVTHTEAAPGRLATLGLDVGPAHAAEMAPLASLAQKSYPELLGHKA
jgi:hypothetical protein